MRSGNIKCNEGDQPPKSSYLPSEENGKNANASLPTDSLRAFMFSSYIQSTIV